MGIKQDLCTYFNDHSFTKRARATAVREFEAMLEGVDERLCQRALASLKAHNIRFEDSKSASFDGLLCKLKAPFNRKEAVSMWHEISHAVDFVRSDFEERIKRGGARSVCYKPVHYSGSVILSSGMTLDDTVRDELRTVGESLYDEVISRFRSEALDKLGEGLADEYFRAHEELKRHRYNRRKFRIGQYGNFIALTKAEQDRIIAELRAHTLTWDEENAYNTLIAETIETPEVRAFFSEYDTVLDMISGIADTRHILPGHSRTYMRSYGGSFGSELFAELLASEAVGNERNHSTTRELLPRSYAAYLELREIILAK